jgi:hypothetical protein
MAQKTGQQGLREALLNADRSLCKAVAIESVLPPNANLIYSTGAIDSEIGTRGRRLFDGHS